MNPIDRYVKTLDAEFEELKTDRVSWSSLTAQLRAEANAVHTKLIGITFDGEPVSEMQSKLFTLAALAIKMAELAGANPPKRVNSEVA